MEHLARKVAVLLDTEEPMMEQLQAHDQLDLLYDMEQPLAAVLAKWNRGIEGRAPDPPRYAGGKRSGLGALNSRNLRACWRRV